MAYQDYKKFTNEQLKQVFALTGKTKPELIQKTADVLGGYVTEIRAYSYKSFAVAYANEVGVEISVKSTKDGSKVIKALYIWDPATGEGLDTIDKKKIS